MKCKKASVWLYGIHADFWYVCMWKKGKSKRSCTGSGAGIAQGKKKIQRPIQKRRFQEWMRRLKMKTFRKKKGILIAIDPGHQAPDVDMSAKEPNAPGSNVMKAKATGGTSGRYSGIAEYELNLAISLMLRGHCRTKDMM